MGRIGWLLWLLVWPTAALGLVSEGRPGIPYFGHVLFLDQKIVEGEEVRWVSLAYGDAASGDLQCNNRVDVFAGKELFRAVPEQSWVLVDYQLQSILIEEGFSGDADVFQVRACEDVEQCCQLRDRLAEDPAERARRAQWARPQTTEPANLSQIARELEIGRQLVKAARCRGCHRIEGFGADHGPSLTWKRYKYEPGWLEAYLQAPYRMRPGLRDLMMLNYSSPNAQPNLQPTEIAAVARYLPRVAWTKSPADRFAQEPWQGYDCYACHTRLYREQSLAFVPTALPEALRRQAEATEGFAACLGCHAFGDLRPPAATAVPPGPNAFAPDLLLAMEKLEANYFLGFVQDPAYLQPGAKMPKLPRTEAQQAQLRALILAVKEAIAAGSLRPVHNHYRMEKRSP
jgi:mono/diheme cytochrome c family protein